MFISVASCELGSTQQDVRNELISRDPSRITRLAKTGFLKTHKELSGQPELSMALRALNSIQDFKPKQIDTIIFVSTMFRSAPSWTQEFFSKGKFSPDTIIYRLQEACAGFVSAISLAGGLIEAGKSTEVMIVTADSYSNFIAGELALEILFSDSVAISTLSRSEPRSHDNPQALWLKPVAEGSITREGSHEHLGISGGILKMNGAAVFQFTLKEVPSLAKQLTGALGLSVSKMDWVLHQGSKFVVDQLETALDLESDLHFRARDYGNTVSSSIPFQLFDSHFNSPHLGLVGFGMGLTVRIVIFERPSR